MQMVYAFEQNSEQTQTALFKKLDTLSWSTYQLYLYQFLLIGKVAESVLDNKKQVAKRLVVSERTESINAAIYNNPFTQFILKNEVFLKEVEKEKLNHLVDKNLINSLYKELKDHDKYKKFHLIKDFTLKEAKQVINLLFKDIMLKSEYYNEHLEDVFPAWEDDQSVIIATVNNAITHFNPQNPKFSLLPSRYEWKERKDFGKELLAKTIEHEDEYLELISPQLQNWEIERIAKMDTILMKMALSELLHFPTIPIKVTFNEYIDIAKKYSTPKSKDFINGVLDKLLTKLKSENRIKKTGRGLVGS